MALLPFHWQLMPRQQQLQQHQHLGGGLEMVLALVEYLHEELEWRKFLRSAQQQLAGLVQAMQHFVLFLSSCGRWHSLLRNSTCLRVQLVQDSNNT